ncbi:MULTISPECIES: NUDIX hydrolase [unclassified Methylobacterium]|uniref:NUDIX hydrolase n=1 Tax=unclassified Methylobacterium TaxID=2615210 RepID=UPI00314507FD
MQNRLRQSHPFSLASSSLKPESKRPNLKKLVRKAQAKPLSKPLKQVAALPFRVGSDGQVEVLLITSRDTGRWIIPKGWPMIGRKAHRAAEREAFEEAGLTGRIAADPVGWYRYEKRVAQGRALPCKVRVYPLRVEVQHPRWPEQAQRTLRWFKPEDAARLVHEDDLRRLLAGFAVTRADACI